MEWRFIVRRMREIRTYGGNGGRGLARGQSIGGGSPHRASGIIASPSHLEASLGHLEVTTG